MTAESTKPVDKNKCCHAARAYLAYGKFTGLAGVGVRIIGGCEKLSQRLEVHLCL
jgi:hypothetical protein